MSKNKFKEVKDEFISEKEGFVFRIKKSGLKEGRLSCNIDLLRKEDGKKINNCEICFGIDGSMFIK